MKTYIGALFLLSAACGVPNTTGPQGPTGDDGRQGQQGLQGVAGPQGPAGPAGKDGTTTEEPFNKTVGSRLTPVYERTSNVGDDGTVQTSTKFWGYFDNVRGEQCKLGHASDAKARCLPVSVPATVLYGNSSCAPGDSKLGQGTVLAIAVPVGCGQIPSALYATVNPAGIGCTEGDLHTIGVPFSGQLYTDASGSCTPAAHVPGFDYMTSDGTVSPTQFVEFYTTVVIN